MTIPELSLPYSLPLLQWRVPRCGQHRRLLGNEAYTHSLFVLRALRAFCFRGFEGSHPSIKAWELAEHPSYWQERKDWRSLSFCPLLVKVRVITLVARVVLQILLRTNGSHWGIINQSSFCFLLFLFRFLLWGLFLIFMGAYEKVKAYMRILGISVGGYVFF